MWAFYPSNEMDDKRSEIFATFQLRNNITESKAKGTPITKYLNVDEICCSDIHRNNKTWKK